MTWSTDQGAGWAPGPQGHQAGPGTPGGAGQRRALLVGSALVFVLVVAIIIVIVTSDGSGSGLSSERREDVDLQAALLTQQDVGEGYDPQPIDAADDDEPNEDDEYHGGPECDDLFAILTQDDDRASDARAPFLNISDLRIRRVDHRLDWADEHLLPMADLESATASCPAYTWTDGEDVARITQQIVPMDGPGENTLAYALEAEWEHADGSQSAYGMFRIIWEHDGVRSDVLRSDFRGSGRTAAPQGVLMAGITQELAEVAHNRLVDVLEG